MQIDQGASVPNGGQAAPAAAPPPAPAATALDSGAAPQALRQIKHEPSALSQASAQQQLQLQQLQQQLMPPPPAVPPGHPQALRPGVG